MGSDDDEERARRIKAIAYDVIRILPTEATLRESVTALAVAIGAIAAASEQPDEGWRIAYAVITGMISGELLYGQENG